MPRLTKADVGFPDVARTRASVVVNLTSTPQQIWELLTDPPSWPRWFAGVTSCEATSEPAKGLHATRTIVVNRIRAEEQIIAWQPHQLWAFAVVQTNIPIARRWVERVQIEPTAQGSTVTYATGIELYGWTRFLGPMIGREISKSWRGGLHGIDRHYGNSRRDT